MIKSWIHKVIRYFCDFGMQDIKLAKELEDLESFERRGGGFGDPEAREAHNAEINAKRHQQFLNLNKKNMRLKTILDILKSIFGKILKL